MLIFIGLLFLLYLWNCSFRIDFVVFVYTITSNAATSHQIQQNINQQNEAKEEEIQIIVFDVFRPILEDEEVSQEGSLSQSEDYTFQNRVFVLPLPNGDQGVDDEHDHDAMQVNDLMVVVVQTKQSSSGHQSQVIEKLNPLSPDGGFLCLDALVADKLYEWEQKAEACNSRSLDQLGSIYFALIQRLISRSYQVIRRIIGVRQIDPLEEPLESQVHRLEFHLSISSTALKSDKDGKEQEQSYQHTSQGKLKAKRAHQISGLAEGEEVVVEAREADGEVGGETRGIHDEAEEVGHLHEVQ